jgi:predicted RNA-binding protein associated with RNAse of E/G family
MAEIHLEYIRPGKGTSFYVDELVSVDATRLKTFVRLSQETASALTQNLIVAGMIAPHQSAVSIAKTFFFDEHFDLLIFYGENGDLLGYYSDIGSRLTKTDDGYLMTDWFLDIWLAPDGTLIELDVDEFEEAISQNLLSTLEVDQARATFARLIAEAKKGSYPFAYL